MTTKEPVIEYRGGGGVGVAATKREGGVGHVKFYPYEKGGAEFF